MSATMSDKTAADVHAESIVVDAVCPLVSDNPEYIEWYRSGGVTAIAPTIATRDSARETIKRLAAWHRLLRERQDLLLVRGVEDLNAAKRTGRMGIYFHFQGTDPIEEDLDLIDLYKALGVGVVQLSYNVKNRVGDGCEERTDAGLSNFGVKLIERLNQANVIVDCSHTGFRTAMEAIECSSAPVILSHSNLASAYPSARNVRGELIDAVARSGGVIGAVGFPGMVSAKKAPSLDDFVAHIDAIVERVGIDHVGLGIDYYTGQAGVSTDAAAVETYTTMVRAGLWGAAYPPPPHHYPKGIETPKSLPNLTSCLMQHGYQGQDVRKILGLNWSRVMKSVWDGGVG